MVERATERIAFRVPAAIGAGIALVIQILVALALFCIISGAAVFLNEVTSWLEMGKLAPSLVIQGMRGLELLLWAADVICFVMLIVVEVKNFCAKVWSGDGER